MIPPSECPQAMVRDGVRYVRLNTPSVLTWSGSACWMAHPVLA